MHTEGINIGAAIKILRKVRKITKEQLKMLGLVYSIWRRLGRINGLKKQEAVLQQRLECLPREKRRG